MTTGRSSSSGPLLKDTQPEEFDLVILGGGTGSTLGQTAGHRADIFASGAILYEMLTGRLSTSNQPTLRRTSALVTEWSQSSGTVRTIGALLS